MNVDDCEVPRQTRRIDMSLNIESCDINLFVGGTSNTSAYHHLS